MTETAKVPAAILQIIPNPRTYPIPYRMKWIDKRVDRTVQVNFDLNLEKLNSLFAEDNPESYGQYLFDQVFTQSETDNGEKGEARQRFHSMLNEVANLGEESLNIKLDIASTLPELHALAWEYLFDGQEMLALSADRRITFFRDIDVDQPQRDPVQEIPRILIAVISPGENNLAQFNQQFGLNLQPIQVETELERLRILFETLRPNLLYQFLPSPVPFTGAAQSDLSTRDQLSEALADGQFHVLHLLCHGVIIEKRAWLILLLPDGQIDLVSEQDFANLFTGNVHLRLVILSACQTAQQSQAGSFSGIVPQLMNRIPAAIGMQRIWFTGIADTRFTRAFYKELSQGGYVDRALQRARQELRMWHPDRWEWGTPVLYLRLGKGQLFQAKESPAPPLKKGGTEAAPRKGGTGLKIGSGAKVKDTKIDASVAGGNIVTGTEFPEDVTFSLPGVGIEIEEAEVEGLELRGEYAGGGIYRNALTNQAKKSYSKIDEIQAVQNQIAYYQKQVQEIQSQLSQLQSDQKGEVLKAQLLDIQDEINDLQHSLEKDNT